MQRIITHGIIRGDQERRRWCAIPKGSVRQLVHMFYRLTMMNEKTPALSTIRRKKGAVRGPLFSP